MHRLRYLTSLASAAHAVRDGLLLLMVLMLTGCQGANPSPTPSHPWDGWAQGRILDARTGGTLPKEQWLKGLGAYEVIYLGEEHYNRHHIDAALAVLNTLVAQGRRPLLAMEMFGWDGQAALDRYVTTNDLSRADFMEQSQWKQNWGGEFEHYERLVQFAKDEGLVLKAMNPPKGLIRQVVSHGVTAIRAQPAWREWDLQEETIVDDPAYRTRIVDQLQACHGGGAPEDYEAMYGASMVRDEGMAKTVAAAVKQVRAQPGTKPGPVVSYTGGGHVQYRLPVPNRVARRLPNGVRQVTVYLATYEPERAEELWKMMQEGVADYVWLTPPGAQGVPRRCR